MDSFGRLTHTWRRDRNRAGSVGKRAADAKAKAVARIEGGVPATAGGAEAKRLGPPGTAADDTAPAISSGYPCGSILGMGSGLLSS